MHACLQAMPQPSHRGQACDVLATQAHKSRIHQVSAPLQVEQQIKHSGDLTAKFNLRRDDLTAWRLQQSATGRVQSLPMCRRQALHAPACGAVAAEAEVRLSHMCWQLHCRRHQ